MTSDKDCFKDFKGACNYPSRNFCQPNSTQSQIQTQHNTQVDFTQITLTQTSLSQISTFNPNKSTFLNQPVSPINRTPPISTSPKSSHQTDLDHAPWCEAKEPRENFSQKPLGARSMGSGQPIFSGKKWKTQQKLNMKILLHTNLLCTLQFFCQNIRSCCRFQDFTKEDILKFIIT